jgi:hypothetical protein
MQNDMILALQLYKAARSRLSCVAIFHLGFLRFTYFKKT